MREIATSWGRVTRAEHEVLRPSNREAPLPVASGISRYLPRGAGRSYGDVGLNADGGLWDMAALDRFIAFDDATGVVRCEAGMRMAALLAIAVPRRWFPPVTPGTKEVTLGGALANDVHGKNHHVAGTFGRHVRRFELARADGERLVCAPDENPELFAATIGGLGLTGAIIWIELQLRRIPGPWLEVETIPFGSLGEFFTLSRESDASHEHTVAWIDAMTPGAPGVFSRANHAPGEDGRARARGLRLCATAPFNLVRRPALRAFHAVVRARHARRATARRHYDGFFYPLDGLADWNRLYGPAGFFQYQCAPPASAGPEAARAVLDEVARSGECCALGVLKMFGDLPSPGLLSFPMAGPTLALDFPNRGARTRALFDRLDLIVRAAGGRLYPAKDARMAGDFFRQCYPGWRELARRADPAISSDFWRRTTEGAQT